MVNQIVKFFTSLRLTVVLLIAGLLLVFLGTLAQVHEGLFDAQVRYFKSWFIVRPTIGNARWPIILPGGYLIGTMLLLNLLAAHIKRFQFTWKKAGIHLIHGGLILLLLGQLLTDALSHESAMRLSEGTSRNYSEAFRESELVVVDTTDRTSDQVTAIPERLLAAKGEIHDASLPFTVRVLDYWVNCDVEEAPPTNAIPVASDRGSLTNLSIVPQKAEPADSKTAHPSVLVEVIGNKGSLGNFLVVGNMRSEESFRLANDEWNLSMLYAPMLGGTVLVAAPAGQMGSDNMISFSAAELARMSDLTNKATGLIFRVKGFWQNAKLYHQRSAGTVSPKVTGGILANSFVIPGEPVTDSNHRNLPGALVELKGSSGTLGTWLLWANPGVPRDMFALGGKTYELGLQFKRFYEPYSIGLVKFTHEKYKGTEIPKNFSSRLRVMNPGKNEDRQVDIRMNEPLRYAGTTYYQGGFDEFDPRVSILQVVTNPSWLTPYLACVMVGAGLIVQFMSHLIGFAGKLKKA